MQKPSDKRLDLNRKESHAIFVGSRHAFAATPGGQQLCTQEFIDTIERAGYKLHKLEFQQTNRLIDKVMRRIDKRPYRYFLPDELEYQIVSEAELLDSSIIFLNTSDLAPLAEKIKVKCGARVTTILLSHGLESADFLHDVRFRTHGHSEFIDGKNVWAHLEKILGGQDQRLGRLLIEEARQREFLDGVVTLAEHEAWLERWLGASRVTVLPRTVMPTPFEWCPRNGRIGYVGRLDHIPNLEGLELVLRSLEDQCHLDVRVRLVGAPAELGAQFASRFSFVDYLGVISDPELLREAQSWTVAANPVFCYPRGASTKLATYLGWGLPVVSTTAGARGYEWSSGKIPISDDPSEFATMLVNIATIPSMRDDVRLGVLALRESVPSGEEISCRLSTFVESCKNSPDLVAKTA